MLYARDSELNKTQSEFSNNSRTTGLDKFIDKCGSAK